MKTILVFLALILVSCTKPNCDEKLKALYLKKANAFTYTQTSAQIQELERQFDNEERKILSDCK